MDTSYEGKGVFKSERKTVFVDGLLPGEEAVIEVKYSRNGTLFGEVDKILEKNRHRVEPDCPVFLRCGGCSFQNADYAYELEIKRKMVEDQLRKIGKIDFPVKPLVGMDSPVGYRNKVQMPVGLYKSRPALGFYAPYSHRLVPAAYCPNDDPITHGIAEDFASLLDKLSISPYDEDRGRGDIRHLIMRTSRAKREVLLGIVTRAENFPRKKELIAALRKKHPEIVSVVQNINPRHTNVILGNRERILYGKGYVEEELLGLKFKISLSSFFQTNVAMAESLFGYLKNHAEIGSDDTVLDAYSGTGTIGLLLSGMAKRVIGVEVEHSACIDAANSAKDNGINNFEMVEGDATEYIGELAKEKADIGFVVMDPPRKGSTPEFIGSVLSLSPRNVIYVSCNPGTLARDLVDLLKGFEIKEIQPFDMFPRTFHVETVCLLSRK